MFSTDDFKIESIDDLAEFLVVLPFIGLVAPFVLAAYTVGFFMHITGWLDT